MDGTWCSEFYLEGVVEILTESDKQFFFGPFLDKLIEKLKNELGKGKFEKNRIQVRQIENPLSENEIQKLTDIFHKRWYEVRLDTIELNLTYNQMSERLRNTDWKVRGDSLKYIERLVEYNLGWTRPKDDDDWKKIINSMKMWFKWWEGGGKNMGKDGKMD